jgi:hypothetical protein
MFNGVTSPKDHAIETMQVEERRYKPAPEFSREANAQPDIYERGFDEFWTKEAERISWFQPWKSLYEWKPPNRGRRCCAASTATPSDKRKPARK